jgi:DNA modification methylase
MKFNIIQGDNRDTLKTLADNSVDAIVTDPPYGIDFLGKAWDANTGALETYQECLRVLKPGGYCLAFSSARTYHHLAVTLEQAGFEIRDQIMWIYSSGFPKAQQIPDYPGWKTALKPAHEPICMARKPFKGSTKANMNKWGVGALNIDATRIPNETANNQGRFPANLIHDGSEEVIKQFPQTGSGNNKGAYLYSGVEYNNKHTSLFNGDKPQSPSNYNDNGSAARFFYCPKVSKKERMIFNNHPTVKPIQLMSYLIKLVTPANSTVLDPFCGSGSTGMAAIELGHRFIGCELDPDYVEIAEKRIRDWNTPSTTFEEIFDV